MPPIAVSDIFTVVYEVYLLVLLFKINFECGKNPRACRSSAHHMRYGISVGAGHVMPVVSNTSPLNYLVLIGEIEILPALHHHVVIPVAVFDPPSRTK